MDSTLAELSALGVISEDEPAGFGIWDDLADRQSCQLSANLLGELAEVSPAVAIEVSNRALAGAFGRRGEVTETGSVTFDASVGGGGRITGRSLVSEPPTADVPLLTDLWGRPALRPRLHIGDPDWSMLWWPEWSESSGWQLRGVPRADCQVTELPRGHGFDESVFQHVALGAEAVFVEHLALGPAEVIDGFTCHGIGLVAISIATARRAVDRAREYSRNRRQGGALIGEHDAVAELLANSENSIAAAAAMLEGVLALEAGIDRLHLLWRTRAEVQPLLSRAGSDALQVFGGIGYMRDVGPERDQRDLNSLRRLGGSPTELTLRCAALDDHKRSSR
ncbi:MAG TPA: acyl-CoA dehydrogenase family protein [Aeromicrobium sp.]|nr:acyl-CoA dehydrogenase family protein [Aeromicrobium sp.]